MTNSRRNPGLTYLFLPALVLGFLFAPPAQAQSGNLVPNCGNANIDLTPMTTLPFTSGNVNPSPNGSVDTSACLAALANQDGVKCFTPQNSCTLTVTGEGGASDANTRVAIASGMCSDAPAACTGSGSGNSVAVSVTGGMQYCIYVETTSSQLIGFTLSGTGCGTLPVELQSFSVEPSGSE